MKIIAVYPGQEPYVTEIKNTLKAKQDFVGGFIEAVYPFEDPIALVCNEEGKIMGLDKNRYLEQDGRIYDVVCGPFMICGLGKEDFTDIPENLIEKYLEYFKQPIPQEDEEQRMSM